MKFRVIGMIISVIILVTLIVVMVMTNTANKSQSVVEEEYPSGLIEDLSDDLTDENIDTESGLEKNELAPDFELTTLTGETVRLTDYRGKKVILNFWATWCPPCKVEMPFMESYYGKYKESENVEILAVNMTNMERGRSETVQGFVDEHKLTFPILMDEDGGVTELYKVLAYPTTFIINADGVITDRGNWSLDEEVIKELVDNSN